MNASFFQEMLNTISERGRSLLDRSIGSGETIVDLSRALQSGRGEASGVAIASEILAAYRALEPAEKLAFFRALLDDLTPDQAMIAEAAKAYLGDPTHQTLSSLAMAVESPRQEFFRRLNLAPGATAQIVAMRRDLIGCLATEPELLALDADLVHLLASWFNRGFLVLRRIDWSTPASILEKIIQYEAVHEVRGWSELRRRLDPRDRRCYAFFHPSLVDEPLIFVQVALTREVPSSIQELLEARPDDEEAASEPTTAVFYSISNCQEGLRGISFGSFLIKQVAEDLAQEIPSLKTFVTLSPVPRFAAWLVRLAGGEPTDLLTDSDREALALLGDPGWPVRAGERERLEAVLLPLAAAYLLLAKTRRERPVDPVARFHLGNGARLERINWLGDKSRKGLRQAHGLMVNYLYELKDIEKNHEAYVNDGKVIASRAVRSLLKASEKTKKVVTAHE